jgi:cell division protein FtsW (lipid II flippase)
VAAVSLIALGWVGIARGEELAGRSGSYSRQQLVWAALALGAMTLASLPSYRMLGRWSYAIFAASVGLLIAVYFFPTVHGTHRWIRLAGLSLQPSEFAKVAFVLALARYLMYRENYRRFWGLAPPLALALLPVLLVLREPDLGTSLVFVPVLFLLLFAAGARAADLAKLALCGVMLVPVLWSQMSREQRSRVTGLFEQTVPGEKPKADAYQLHQAKQLLALGGAAGSVWSDEPIEDLAVYHLPESHTDFVLTVIGERLGWLGTGGVLLLFVVLVSQAVKIAEATRDPYGRLLAAGIGGLFGVQVLINSAMTVGLLPVTGLSLPLVSYGGSGMLAHALALGLLLNVGLRPGYEVAPEPFRYTSS